jgi:hypothetical protein
MIITRKEYEALSDDQRNQLKYSNPYCVDDSHVRVGEVLDDELGVWRTATESDF